MRTRFLRGDTTQNNGLTLPAGEIAIDTEKHAVRLHDGSTLGGFEIVGQKAVTGPDQGDLTAGFYGEVAGSNFITYDQLASEIGLSAGTSQFNAESAWLHFSLDGQEVYVAMKPARYNLSWNAINAVGAVYDDTGSPVVSIGGKNYRVTLMRGAAIDPVAGDPSGYDLPEGYGSEWNRLFYPIHSGVHIDANNPAPHADPNAAPYASWASYYDGDLLFVSGNGRHSWTQESTDNNRVIRGYNGVTFFSRAPVSYSTTVAGWRPCLRLVE